MIRERKFRTVIVGFCITFFIALLMLSIITACASKDADYYLSLSSNEWQTYNASKDIPDDVHFKHDGNLYTLRIDLEEGEEFTVNKIGSEEKVGYDQIFSAAEDLIRGENGAIKVAHSGTFLLSYKQDNNILDYSYTARRLSVSITTDVKTLYVGDTYTYKASVAYSDGNTIEENAVWTSSDDSVLSVDENGKVSALSVGSATLNATVGELSDSIEIEVLQSSVPVSGVRLDKTELNLELGEDEKLTATVLPENADSRLVSWSSDDDTVATVSDGTVTAVGYGTTRIVVSTAQGGYTAECTVTVVRHVASMRFDAETLALTAGGESKALSILFLPIEATNKEYTVEITSGETHISVDDNKKGTLTVSGISEGKATIKVISEDDQNVIATCEVTVFSKDSVLADLPQNITAMIDEETSLTVKLENAEIKSVDWSIENDTVATIDGAGASATVTGVNFGSTVVTATITAMDDKVYTATCNVLVSDEWYFIYGYGLGESGYWDYSYVSDKSGAEREGLLFTEMGRGIYTLARYLTPENGFQIIFPKVASYTQYDETTETDVWNKNIPSQWVYSGDYYSSSRSDAQYITNSNSYFCVNTSGVYTITLDLTGTSAKVYIKMVSLDVKSVNLSLKEGNVALKSGSEVAFDFSVSPSEAKFEEKDVALKAVSEFADFTKYVKYDLLYSDGILKVSANGTIPSSFTVTLTLTIRGVSTSVDLYILSAQDEEIPVNSITFGQEHYFVNVNQGGAADAWQQVVKATVNKDATNQAVRYFDVTDYDAVAPHKANTYATVDPVTGLVTAKVLGTMTIQAVSLADEAFATTCLVTFYSDQIYMLGVGYGGWDQLDASYRSLEGTPFESQKFTKLSNTHYQYTFDTYPDRQFEIAFLGMEKTWVGSINYRNLVTSMSSAVEGWMRDYTQSQGGNSVQLHSITQLVIDLDLSKHQAFFTLNLKSGGDFEGFSLIYDQTHTELRKGDTVDIELYLLPDDVQATDITYSLDGEKFIKVIQSADRKKLTLTVTDANRTEDQQVNLSVSVKGKTISIAYTLLAEHHFVQEWNSDYHWLKCTDEVCDLPDHIDEKTRHNQESAWSASPEGHYYACSDCGAQFGLVPHVYSLNNGVFDFSDSMRKCSVCDFDLFKIEGETLVAYYGYAETVIIPENVTVIGANAFKGHSELKELSYSRQMKSFGDYAFAGCSSLKSIFIGNRVTRIGAHAFDGTAAKLSWGKALDLREFGYQSFYGYLGSSIEIPSTIHDLSTECFAYSMLESVVIPSTVKNVGSIFRGCEKLRTVEIDAAIPTLPGKTFSNCTALTTVIIRSNAFYQFDMQCFGNNPLLEAVYIERPLEQLLTCHWLFQGMATDPNGSNIVLKGKVFAYSAQDPGREPFGDAFSSIFGYFRDWFGGCWHWDNSGKQTLNNILIWETEANDIDLATMPAILGDKRDFLT